MFKHAAPEFHAAARFALYAERMVPVFQQMTAIQNAPADPLNAMQKIHAGQAIEAIRPLLFPEDDDG